MAFPTGSPSARSVIIPSGARRPHDSLYGQCRRTRNLALKDSGGSGPTVSTDLPNAKFATDWSRNGTLGLYYELGSGTGRDMWVLSMNGKERLR